MANIMERVAWYIDHQDTPPSKVHIRGVWSDHTDGAGSALGSPALSSAFRLWMELGDEAQEVIERRDEGGAWEAPLLRYRWPMRAALSTAAHGGSGR